MANKQSSASFSVYPLLLYGFIFAALLGYGYFLLIPGQPFLGSVVGFMLALLAIFLARGIAYHGGIAARRPMFILLLLISAVGIFNSLFLNLESRPIFQQRIDGMREGFTALASRANSPVESVDPKYKEWDSRVEAGTVKLLAEIRNSFNCGQGPEARRLIAELQQDLNFAALSVGASGVDSCARLAEAYEKDILPQAKQAHPIFRESRITERREAAQAIQRGAQQALAELSILNTQANQLGPIQLLSQIRPELERLAETYEGITANLIRFDLQRGIASSLNLSDVRSLGEWSQLVNLVISRANQPTTWVYGGIAGFADWMLVYLFLNAMRTQGGRQRSSPSTASSW
jgi:hypothetical protein